jgi:hypothetical protein
MQERLKEAENVKFAREGEVSMLRQKLTKVTTQLLNPAYPKKHY